VKIAFVQNVEQYAINNQFVVTRNQYIFLEQLATAPTTRRELLSFPE